MKKYLYLLQPIVFAINIPIIVYFNNSDLLFASNTIRSLIIISFLALVFTGFLELFYRDILRSCIASSLFFTLFFSYKISLIGLFSVIHDVLNILVDPDTFFGLYTGRSENYFILLFFGGFFILVSILISKSLQKFISIISKILTFLSIVFVITFVAKYITMNISTHNYREQMNLLFSEKYQSDLLVNQIDNIVLPNIYYIILDGYAHHDVIKNMYYYDNAHFIKYLEDSGFYVANNSHANYGSTLQSMASSLNFSYLDPLKSISSSNYPLVHNIQNNQLMRILKGYGYKTVSYHQGSSPFDIQNTDIKLTPRVYLNDFEQNILTITPLHTVIKNIQYDIHRSRIMYTLGNLHTIRDIVEPPYFMYAHIFSPHPPFVFNQDGTPTNPQIDFQTFDGSWLSKMLTEDGYKQAYREQYIYITSRVEEVIGNLTQSDYPTIIILQSDHGSRMLWGEEVENNNNLVEQFSILNAIYFPDQKYHMLYQTITPVNTIRVILNQYLGLDIPKVDDQCFTFPWGEPLNFIDITDEIIEH